MPTTSIGLADYLADLPEFGIDRARKHLLRDTQLIAVGTVLAGAGL